MAKGMANSFEVVEGANCLLLNYEGLSFLFSQNEGSKLSVTTISSNLSLYFSEIDRIRVTTLNDINKIFSLYPIENNKSNITFTHGDLIDLKIKEHEIDKKLLSDFFDILGSKFKVEFEFIEYGSENIS